jgi:hypothetical protein
MHGNKPASQRQIEKTEDLPKDYSRRLGVEQIWR